MGDEIGNSTQQQVHMSADDLNDGFILDNDDKKTLAYQVRWRSRIRCQMTWFRKSELCFFVFSGWKMEH